MIKGKIMNIENKYADIEFKTPFYVVDEALIKKNLKVLKTVADRTGAKILLAQKAFSMYSIYPLIAEYLSGTTASSLHEARLGYEEMPNKETHIYAPAFSDDDFDEIIKICDHIVFNSFSQWDRHKAKLKNTNIKCGIRINPEYSEIETDMYNPCFEGSRMGVTLKNFRADDLEGISGLHFHTMCEQNSDTLKRTVMETEKKFGEFFYDMEWINFGGGHHITRDDYDIDTLCETIEYVRDKYDVAVYLEPGEAIALNAGFLVSEVMDIIENGVEIGILDTSAACHMPDVLEMPYRPHIIGSGKIDEKPYSYRFGGPTCLSGDVIGDYSFDEPLKVGDRLTFCDMAIYSTVKNNTFNGINLPSILYMHEDNSVDVVRTFGYEDFKSRL